MATKDSEKGQGKLQQSGENMREKTLSLEADFSESGYLPLASNHVIIRNTKNDVLLDFCYVDPVDVEKAAKKNKTSVPTLVVTRISLPPNAAKELADALSGHMKKNFKQLPSEGTVGIKKEGLN